MKLKLRSERLSVPKLIPVPDSSRKGIAAAKKEAVAIAFS